MAWEFYESLNINGVETNWTFSQAIRDACVNGIPQNRLSGTPESNIGCDNQNLDFIASEGVSGSVIIGEDTYLYYAPNSNCGFTLNNVGICNSSFGGATYSHNIIAFLKDDVNQLALVVYIISWTGSDTYFVFNSNSQQHELYQFLEGLSPVSYTWQSVPSISGKNGILPLTQIKAESINDGEPVSGASDSAFTGMSDDNNVATLVDVGELNNNKAKVVYNIPALTSGNYSYAKLVYKQGFIPTSKDDGTAVDLDLTDLGTNKTITVSNIVSGSVYWFVIFTDKSESDAVSLGENTEGVFFELDLTTDGRDVIRYNPAKEFLGAKQGELVGNNFTISDGVLDTSYDISWYYDPTENPKSIPADCTLTFEYDTFFPNGEGYLDWYIIDSDDTERIYWCFDTKHAFQANKWYNCKVVAKVENGKITRYKYVLDGAEVSCGTGDNILMPCTNTDTSKGISRIYFDITRQTKFKNMSIYYDFSEYHDGGGSGSGSSSGT